MEQSEIEKIIEEISSRLETKMKSEMSEMKSEMSEMKSEMSKQYKALEKKMSKLDNKLEDELYTIKRQNEMNANRSSGSGGFLEGFSQASAARARSRDVNPYYLR